MKTAEIIYLSMGILAVGMSLPQLVKIWRSKRSDEFHIMTWTAMFMAQIISFIYAISIGARVYIALNIAWLSFHFLMIFLIMRFRRTGLAYEQVDEINETSDQGGE